MKIDLKAGFEHVSRLLKASDQPNPSEKAARADFQRLLSDVAPESNELAFQPTKMGVSSTVPPNPLQETYTMENEMMGRLSHDPPSLFPPDIERQTLTMDQIPEVKEEIPSVKTPTVISATREAQDDRPLTMMRRDERESAVMELVERTGTEHGVDPLLGMGVVNAESAFDPNAISRDGHFSKGLFQLLDTTAKNIMQREGIEEEYDPFEPEQNVDLGMRYLRYLHDLFNGEKELPNNMTTYPAANSSSLEKLAVAAYNAGEGRVASAQDRAARAGMDPTEFSDVVNYLPKTTQEYVARVMQYKLDSEGELFGNVGDEL